MRIIFTSDTHGHVLPIDYATNERKNLGLLCMASQMEAERERDGNTLVMDGGDSLQGTPLMAYYLRHRDEFDFNPMAEGFNAMGLDYYTMGNHDFNFGYDAFLDFADALNATLICANVEDKRGELGIKKYAIHVLEDGTRVGITGAVTGYVNTWEKKKNLKDYVISDPIEALREELEVLRGKCDITVCIYHGGFEEDLKTGDRLSESTENQACRIIKEMDFDIILTGHQHMPVEGILLGRTFGVQTPDKATKYCVIDADYVGDDENLVLKSGKLTSRGWGVVSWFIPVEEKHADYDKILGENPKIKELESRVQEWLDKPIGCLQEAIIPESKLDVALHGSRLAALFNQVQLELTGADFSNTSLANEPLGLPKEISVRDILGIYRFDNTVVVKEVTGSILKEALERCAEYYDLDKETGKIRVSQAFLKPKVEHYNFDIYAGLWYEFDLRRPVGDRVVVLKMLDGTDLSDDKTYSLATSNYRATGTGGYGCLAGCKTLKTYEEEMPDLLIDYVRRNSPIGEIKNCIFNYRI